MPTGRKKAVISSLLRLMSVRTLRRLVGLAVLLVAVAYLLRVVGKAEASHSVADVAGALTRDPAGVGAVLAAYAGAFWLRAWSWRRVLPELPPGQAWAALHVCLFGNHVLPFRLGEALRPISVVRRTAVPLRPAVASTVALRAADLLAVLALALVAAPALLVQPAGRGAMLLVGAALVAVLVAALVWSRRSAALRAPGASVAAAALLAWALEATVVWEVARVAGLALSPYEAVGVTAVTIAAQALAVTPAGLGSYEAAATAALVALGNDPGPAFAVALSTHALKTAYALGVGGLAFFVPAPSFWGRFRLAPAVPARPPALPVALDAPVVVIIPTYDEEGTVGEVVRRVPDTCGSHRVVVIVIDDGSTDGSAAAARTAGARVVAQPANLGLGAAVRRGLAEASALNPAAVVYLDADAEYFPEDVDRVAAPVLGGRADYVVGSRFAGEIRRMLVLRRAGNVILTHWLRRVARSRTITDGQSGFRAFSAAAAADAEIIHDYNYAQVLTLDLLAKGYRYAEVPITYAYRESGTSFVRVGRYLRRVVPAVHRELNTPSAAQSSTTWLANRCLAAPQATSSNVPSEVSAATAS